MPTRARWTRTPRLAPDGSALGADDAPLGPSASLGEAEACSDESVANPHMELVLANPDLAGRSPVGTTFEVRKIVNGAEAALSITSGSQTTDTGIVGSIATADLAVNGYQWESFTYVQNVGGQEFGVINYWVQ